MMDAKTASSQPLPEFVRQLREHLTALIVLAVALSAYFLLQTIHLFGEKWSALVEHLLLTLMVVVFVHVLDHMFLSRGLARMIQFEFRPVSAAAKQSLNQLEAASASFASMRDSGMTQIYSSRAQASAHMAAELVAPDVESICLAGVSLNDFILDNSKPLNFAYQQISDRLKTLAELGSTANFRVRFLIVDPYSFGAQQRHQAETQAAHAPPGRLEHDVETVAKRLLALKCEIQDIKQCAKSVSQTDNIQFDCRLYRSAPQLFLVWTDRCCYVEQYYLWSSRDAQSTVPVLRFQPPDAEPSYQLEFDQQSRKNMHSEMQRHFDWIWDHGSVTVEDFVEGHIVGCDKGLCQAGAVNVYMDQNESAERIKQLLRNVTKGSEIDLMGISLRSFFEDRFAIAEVFRDYVLRNSEVTARILCLDPESPQAILRSYREALLGNETLTFASYRENAQLHRESTLFRDTEVTIRRLSRLCGLHEQKSKEVRSDPNTIPAQRKVDCDLHAWKYDCAPSCFMLRVDNVVLFEPYSYGKLDRSAHAPTLGGDMPLFEFHRNTPAYLNLFGSVEKRNPWGLLNDHFDFVAKISTQLASVE